MNVKHKKNKEPPSIEDIDIEKLLKQQEDENFDRTRGGQDNIGIKITAMGTKNGGMLLVGQDDLAKGGKTPGINETDFQREFTNAISNVRPAPLTRQKIFDYKGVKLAVISIQNAGSLRPCSYKGVYYERKGDSNVPLQPEEVKRYHLSYGSANTEDMPTHASRKDIDEEELALYAKKLGKNNKNILDSVTSENNYLTLRGVIVLSKKPEEFLEGCFFEVQRYSSMMGTAPEPVGTALKISKPARQLVEEVTALITQNLPVSRRYEGAKMIEAPAIPVIIIREAVANAVAHRNYRSHEHIRVRIYDDGFDISNPAVLTQKMWFEILSTHTTYHPNEGIYTFLNSVQLYEGRGEGLWKIRDELERLGKTEPEFKVIGETPSTFYVRISLSPAHTRDAQFKVLEKMLGSRADITASDVIKKLNVSRVTAIKLLNTLVDEGRLEHTGAARTSRYIVRHRYDEQIHLRDKLEINLIRAPKKKTK